jgi:hypothetical protein
MSALDLKGPNPLPKSLEEAQQVIDALWPALVEAREQLEQLEEQLPTTITVAPKINTHRKSRR